MDLPQLSYFLSIAEHGGFSQAARRRNISQSALSRQMTLLEAELGVRLFERYRHGVALTEAGDVLLRGGARLLKDASALKTEVLSRLESPVGELGVGLPPSISRLFAVPLIETFSARYPNVRLHVLEGTARQISSWLAEGRIDVGVVTGDTLDGSQRSVDLASEPLTLIGTPGRLAGVEAPVSLAALSSFPLIANARPYGLRALIEDRVRASGGTITVTLEIETLGLSIDLCRRGMGCLVLPGCAVIDEVASGELAALPIKGLNVSWTAAWAGDRPQTAAGQKMVAELVAASERLTASGRWGAVNPSF